jgi:hypothetical protein
MDTSAAAAAAVAAAHSAGAGNGTLQLQLQTGMEDPTAMLLHHAAAAMASIQPRTSTSTTPLASPNSAARGRWAPEDDALLKAAVERFEAKNWKSIAWSAFGPLKSDVQCLHRWQKVLRPGLIKGPWSPEEDALVITLVQQHGLKKWSLIAGHLKGRLGKQCRERWYNHLDPAINKAPWTTQEDELVIQLHTQLGNKW